MRLIICAGLACVALLGSRAFAEEPAFSSDLQQLAVESEAVVVARVGGVSSLPPETCGGFALWIVRSIKGRLRGGRNIVWIGHDDLPAGSGIGEQLWLLFLRRDQDAAWRTNKGPDNVGLVKLSGIDAPVLRRAMSFLGYHGEPPDFPELACACDLTSLIQQAAATDLPTSRQAISKLATFGPDAIPVIQDAEANPDRQIASVGRTLLPLLVSGPAVNGLRLGLRPTAMDFHDNEQHVATLNLCNITQSDILAVTGETLRGEVIQTVTAFDVFKTDAKLRPIGTPLPGTLTMVEIAVNNPKSHSHPLIHKVPGLSVYPLDLELSVEVDHTVGSKAVRLRFPLGYVDLPGFGSYVLRAHFDCAGPRPDQEALETEGFWLGGQLVSNEMVITVSPNRTPETGP